MPDFKEWPFIGRVIGAMAALAVVFCPLLVTAFSLGSTANSLASMRSSLESLTIEQGKIREKLTEQSNASIQAGYANSSRFQDMERRISALEAAALHADSR